MPAPSDQTTQPREQPQRQGFFRNLGPGLITGAADDDPSGISTYSVAGASFGYLPLWTAILSFPLMAAVQLMCARLGMVTGLGLAGVIRRRYSPGVLWAACALLVVANIINIAADLGGMAAATRLVIGVPAALTVPVYGLTIVVLLMWWSYSAIARVFKWLTLVLLAYVVTAFVARVDWRLALHATLVPRMEWSKTFFSLLVAILGTTISPYLFFWQAAQEVEEERAMGRDLAHRRGATPDELRKARTDVLTGMFASNAIMYFIILTTAATLHASGQTNIATAQQAAEALRPVAGAGAYWLFTLGLIGTGMLAVPVLAGSCAYAIAEAAAWRGSLDRQPWQAGKFYLVLATSSGLVKKTKLTDFDSPRAGGIIAINLREDDEVIAARLVSPDDDLVLVSRKAQAIRFRADDEALRPMGRATSGVIGMRFSNGDELLGMHVVRAGADVLVATEGGYAKRTPADQYPVQGRGGRGVLTARIVETRGELVGALMVRPEDEVFAITSVGGVIRTSAAEIKMSGRQTMGVRLVNLAGGQSLVAIARNAESAEAIGAAGADDGGAEDDPGEVADDDGPAAEDAADVSDSAETGSQASPGTEL
jgi:NRAMP (natural resistance-associated macrophage protein)-like metal ion transporter